MLKEAIEEENADSELALRTQASYEKWDRVRDELFDAFLKKDDGVLETLKQGSKISINISDDNSTV